MTHSVFFGAQCLVRGSVPWFLPARELRDFDVRSAATFLNGSGDLVLGKTRRIYTTIPVQELVGIFSASAVEMAFAAANSLHRLQYNDGRLHSDDVRVRLGAIERYSFTHLPSWYYDDILKERA